MECSLDGAPFAACTSPQSYTSLDEGAHTFEVRAIDQAANLDPSPASYAWTVDTVAPEVRRSSSTPDSLANADTPELPGPAENGSTVRIWGPRPRRLHPRQPRRHRLRARLHHDRVTVTVAEDTNTDFRATDAAGNTSACGALFTYLEDSTAPETDDRRPPGPTANSTPPFTFTGTDPGGTGVASLECSLDGAPFAACSSPQSYTSLDEGAHSFEVRALDQAANPDPSPASYAWTVDTVAPEAPRSSSTSDSLANENSPELPGTAEAGSTSASWGPDRADCTPANLAATGPRPPSPRPG